MMDTALQSPIRFLKIELQPITQLSYVANKGGCFCGSVRIVYGRV